MFAGQSSIVIPWSLKQVFTVFAVWVGAKCLQKKSQINESMSLVSRREDEVPGAGAVQSLNLTKHSGHTPAAMMAPQIMS